MHHFQTTLGTETVVAAPKPGELLAGNPIGTWAPVEANDSSEIKVLAQKSNEAPAWVNLLAIPEYNMAFQHASIDDPKASDFGIPAVMELQMLVLQILETLREAQLIAKE